MQVVEEYKEIVERDPVEISIFWKLSLISCYVVCSVSGYCCSILYYIFWHEIFGGHCPFGAKLTLGAGDDEKIVNQLYNSTADTNTLVKNLTYWQQYVIIEYEDQFRCKIYYIFSCCSCAFAFIWLALFFLCGKGGYSTSIYPSPWRVVLPALLFSLVFAVITLIMSSDMQQGYSKYCEDLTSLFYQVKKLATKSDINILMCTMIQHYTVMYNDRNHNVCNVFFGMKLFSWTMSCSWVGGLLLLALRIIRCEDFRLLKVKIYKISGKTLPPSTRNAEVNQSQLI